MKIKKDDIVVFRGKDMLITNNKSYRITHIDEAFSTKYQYLDRFWVLSDYGIPYFFYEDNEDWLPIKELRKQKLQKINLI